LITFYLYEKGCLSQPLLYLSEFFEKYRDEYYKRLLAVSQKGDFREWIEYFLRGVANQAEDAVLNAKKILDLHVKYQQRLNRTKYIPDTAYRLINEIFSYPVISISRLSKKWKLPFNSIKTGIIRLIKIGILREAPLNTKRNKLFIAPELMDLLVSTDRKRYKNNAESERQRSLF